MSQIARKPLILAYFYLPLFTAIYLNFSGSEGQKKDKIEPAVNRGKVAPRLAYGCYRRLLFRWWDGFDMAGFGWRSTRQSE